MKKVRVSHKGRVCKFPDCKRLLSIYNHGCYCYLHLYKLVASGELKAAR